MATTTAASPALEQISYEDLYARWERGNWRATEIDLGEDREQWLELSEFERRATLFNYAQFFCGEDAVADALSPYIDAAPLEEQKYFLATQQVDEARHAVLFKRFMEEVVGLGDGSVAAALAAVRPQLSWGFRRVFERLERMAGELRRDPSPPRLSAAVTLYHVIIEASMAQPGQHMIERYLERRDILPGFRAGMRNVSLDEQRHIAFGVKLLADVASGDEACRRAVADLLREVVPWTASVLVPPDGDERYVEAFGITREDIGEEGALSLETKLRSAGLAIDELPGPEPMPMDLPPRARAERGQRLVQAGVIGERNGPPARDPDTMALLFDTMRRAVDPDHGLDRPTTLQWDFADADPWHLRIDNGSASAHPGRAPAPDVTLRCRYEDWVDVIGGRRDPRRLMLTGRLRPRGNVRALARLPRVFGR